MWLNFTVTVNVGRVCPSKEVIPTRSSGARIALLFELGVFFTSKTNSQGNHSKVGHQRHV